MDADKFAPWAMDDARTIEERFCVELLVEVYLGHWHSLNKVPYNHNWDARLEHKRQRNLNPAYVPQYTEESVCRVAEVLPRVTTWSAPFGLNERPVRDIKALRFLPNLVELQLQAGVEDLSPLLEMPQLRKLGVSGKSCPDLRVLGQCGQLRELHLTLGTHWPEVAGLEALTQLEVFHLAGNLLAFARGVVFPNVVRGVLDCSPLPARCVRDLPQFPACQFLTLGGVERLDGIEALPRLRNLTLTGEVRDFSPLAALTELTCLTCASPHPLAVTPLARLPKLAYAAFTHNYHFGIDQLVPRDYSPLAEAPALRELHVPNCPPVTVEVATLNSIFPPWSELFALPAPRPLPPLRLISAPWEKLPPLSEMHLMPGETEPMDDGLRQCELHWAARLIGRAVSRRLGAADWGQVETTLSRAAARVVNLRVESFAVVEKLGLIVEAVREALARIQPEYRVELSIDLKTPKLKPTAAQLKLQEQFDREQEEHDWEQRKRERAEYLDRLHRFRLKQEGGGPVKPEEFAAPAPEPPPSAPWDREDDGEDDENMDEGTGDVAVKKKPDPPPSWDDNEHPLADAYRMWGRITLAETWLTGDAHLVAFLMGRAPDEVMLREKRAE